MEALLTLIPENPTAKKLLLSAGAILLIIFIVYVVQIWLNKYVGDSETRYRARKLLKNTGYLISLLVILAIFSDQLGGLAIFLGAAGAGIAFALQEVIASFAGWIAISAGRFYQTGDRVQLGGIKGDVIDISVLRTTLMEVGEWVEADLHTGRIVRIANSFVFKEPVFNYSSSFPFLWDEIKIPIRHGCDFRLARELLQQVVEEVTGTVADAARISWDDVVRSYLIEEIELGPKTTMQITDNWLEFTVRYIVGYKNRRHIKDRLATRIMEEIEKTQQQVVIASTTLAVVESPPLKVLIDGRQTGT
jgi:small-conductance mechanosensitive channel